MKVFVSGATGFIGSRLAKTLAMEGIEVHALYRSEKKAAILKHENIHLFKGDILDKKSLKKAVEGCEQVYHVAAFASVWSKNHSLIYNLNIDGALNVIEASKKAGVKKMVITSTAGVLGSSNGEFLDETSFPDTQFGDYESSKSILESIVRAIDPNNLSIVMVNPSRVYGPGLFSQSNSVTIMIDKYIKGKWHFIPGNGESIGNYVYVDDVVSGHILAMNNGKSGERYILGGDNVTFNEFFQRLKMISGKKYYLLNLPLSLMLLASKLMMFFANNFGIRPMITPAHVKKFNMNLSLNIDKAKKDLKYNPISLDEGIKKTINWLNDGRKL